MGKQSLKKIFLIVFLLSVFLISFLELKNIQQIKVAYRSEDYTKEIDMNRHIEEAKSNSELENVDDVDKIDEINTTNINISEKSIDQGEEIKDTAIWKSIERKDSYNNELQFYCKSNVLIEGDIIDITSVKEKKEDKIYTSGLVESTRAYKYGYYEFVIEISEGKGLFPAIWFLPNKGGALPEIDLFEMIGSEPYTFYGVIHFKKNGVQDSDHFAHEVPIKEQYSVSLEWNAESITWYIDQQEMYTTTQGVPQEYMFIVINQAIGGNWPGNPDGTIFPNHFRILSSYIEPEFEKGRD